MSGRVASSPSARGVARSGRIRSNTAARLLDVAAAVVGEERTAASILGVPARFRCRGGGEGHGGDGDALRFVQGGFNRRRRAAAAWSAHGHGAVDLGFLQGGRERRGGGARGRGRCS